ncbi:MAG: YfbK domain-containing protein [Planctomycetota bacterium]|jgi:Ca-activated chloride channel family protein
MNSNHREPTPRELAEARLTAYALGQLDAAEQADFEREMAASAELRQAADEIRAVAGGLREASGHHPPGEPSPELRAAVENHFSQSEDIPMATTEDAKTVTEPLRGRRRWIALAAAACLIIAAVPVYLVVSGTWGPAEREVAMNEVRGSNSPAALAGPTSEETERSEAFDRRLKELTDARGDASATLLVDDSSSITREDLAKQISAAGERIAQDIEVRARVLQHGGGRPKQRDPFPVSGPVTDEAGPAPPRPSSETGLGNLRSDILDPGSVVGEKSLPGSFYAGRPMSQMNYSEAPQSGQSGEGRARWHDVRQAWEGAVKQRPGKGQGRDQSATYRPVSDGDMRGYGAMGGYGGGYEGEEEGGEYGGYGGLSGGYGMGNEGAKYAHESYEEDESGYMYEAYGKPGAGGPVEGKRPSGQAGTSGRPVGKPAPQPVDGIATSPDGRGRPAVTDLATGAKDGKLDLWRDMGRESGYREGGVTAEFDPRDLQHRGERDALERFRGRVRAPGTEQYDRIVENHFLPAHKAPLSTFSIDVDTASYANVRRFLSQGRLPPPDAVRIEEMVNYFRYDYEPPEGPEPFSVDMETAQCPWNGEHRLLRIGLKGREIDVDQRGPSNLVFLLDVSGSMSDQNKLPLVKQAMLLLVDQLTEDDRVAIVTYAGQAASPLESTPAHKKKKILDAIDQLSAGGSTHGSAGIQLAYEQAWQNFVKGGTNRVILATDGDLNVGVTDDDELVQLIQQKAKSGVFLTVLGFGTGNLKDSKLEKLADKGNGTYAYIDSLREGYKVLVEQASGSLVTIAKDVKIQIEFNPAEVAYYRLIGYENRVMAARDFDDDTKDAGEMGAGHTVTALYELVPTGDEPVVAGSGGPELKYQRARKKPAAELTDAAKTGELLSLRLRYKEPDGVETKLLEFSVKDSGKRFGEATPDFQFASAVASFGMVLRGSRYQGDVTLAAVEEFAHSGVGDDPDGYRSEFVELIRRTRKMVGE